MSVPNRTPGGQGQIGYRDADQALVEAFPELAPARERLLADWDNYGGEPPGQFIVFADVLGRYLEALLQLPDGTQGRDEMLKRIIEFAERLMEGGGNTLSDLAIDAVAETLAAHGDGAAIVARHGGRNLQAWFAAYAPANPPGLDPDFIDLWGVREALAAELPAAELTDLAGITSHDIHSLPSLAAAQAVEDGVVIVGSHAFSHLYLVCHADIVLVPESALQELARRLGDLAGGEEPHGEPSAGYRRIPLGERVWQLNRGDERHSRLTPEPWVHAIFADLADAIVEVVRGERARLPSASGRRAPHGIRW